MSNVVEARLCRVWLALCAITLLTWWLGSEQGQAVTYLALLIAAIKVRIIVVQYMEAARAGRTLQRLMDAWLLLLVAALASIYAFELQMPPV